MFPTLDVRFSVDALFVSDRNIQDFQVQLARSKEQVKVAEWIEIAEVRPVCHDALVALFGEDFCAAESVLHLLAQQPTEQDTEQLFQVDNPMAGLLEIPERAPLKLSEIPGGTPGSR